MASSGITGTLTGFHVNKQSLAISQLWSNVYASRDTSVLQLAARDPTEHVYSQAKVLFSPCYQCHLLDSCLCHNKPLPCCKLPTILREVCSHMHAFCCLGGVCCCPGRHGTYPVAVMLCRCPTKQELHLVFMYTSVRTIFIIILHYAMFIAVRVHTLYT